MNLESKLAKQFNSPFCLYTANGTSALYLCFLEAKKRAKRKLLIPNITCPVVVVAALKAGLNVEFGDINLNDYTLDLKLLKEQFFKNPFDCILITHIYGHLCKEELFDFCIQNNIFIIEDSAQTYKVNPKADLSILSFGWTKFLQNPLGGGCILSSKLDLTPLRIQNEFLQEEPLNLNTLFQNYRKEFYALDPEEKNYFSKLKALLMANCYIFKKEAKNEFLEKQLANFQSILSQRKEKMQSYQTLLKHPLILHPKLEKESIVWRYTFRFLGPREKFLQILREEGIDCSSWYMQNSLIFKNLQLKQSEILQNQVVNLWTCESLSEERLIKNIKFIADI